jgi:hypothetical protein
MPVEDYTCVTCHSDTRTAIASFCMGLQVNVPCCAECCLLLTVCMSSRGAFELAVPMILMLAHCIRNSNVHDILKRQCIMHASMCYACMYGQVLYLGRSWIAAYSRGDGSRDTVTLHVASIKSSEAFPYSCERIYKEGRRAHSSAMNRVISFSKLVRRQVKVCTLSHHV